MSETRLVVQEPQAIATRTHGGILTREALKEAAEQRALLAEYVKQQMVPNTDYGVIPGTKKPSLLKPGAEKLVDIFRCTPEYELLKEEEDYIGGLFAYRFRVKLFQRDAGVVLAEGYGSASSRESRYRWRDASRKCPNCAKATIIKGKEEYGGGWICFAKKGGCGAKWRAGDKVIEGQELGRVENEDIADVANTVLKIAKKRALVDGAIALARVSDLFTQDVEDIGHVAADDGHAEPKPEPRPSKPAVRGVVDDEGVKVAGPAKTDATLGDDLQASVAQGETTGTIANRLLQAIGAGFDNEHHWKAWLNKHGAEIESLPAGMKKTVMKAYDHADHKMGAA